MQRLAVLILLSLLTAAAATAGMLPGFRAELVGATETFVTGIDVDSQNNIYYSAASGEVYRMAPDGTSTLVAQLPTAWEGNAGLLGVALLDDDTAVVHYTRIGRTYHVISRIDLRDGTETILRELASDTDVPGREVSTEHHGGNLTVAADGTIFFGIGDFGGRLPAALPNWIAGKVYRLAPNGRLTQYAMGLRNPYDLAWDPELERVVVSDNGPTAGDELHVITEGSNCGWPFTVGNEEPIEGGSVPDYVFPDTVAPTGLLRVNGRNAVLGRGYLMAAFVTKAIYYFPSVVKPVKAPLPIVDDFDGGAILDVAQNADGDLFFATPMGIYRLQPPARGDCNGDGAADVRDFDALRLELRDGESQSVLAAASGSHAGSWGCDANGDSLIDAGDTIALSRLLNFRRRTVRRF